MTSIPETIAQTEIFLKTHPEFASLFSDYTYSRLQARDPNHPLLQLEQILDFTSMEVACRDYHKNNSMGAPVTHSVSKLLRSLLIKYLYDYSLRETEFNIRYNLLIKWFVGYTLSDQGPDHSTLERFELYLILNHPRLFFDTVLKQIDACFPDDRTQPQIGDTFAVHADAALESLIKRLRHSCQKLLRALQKANPAAYDQLWGQLNWVNIFGDTDEKIEYYLARDKRQ